MEFIPYLGTPMAVAGSRQCVQQRLRQILVQLDFHAAAGTGGTGISPSADAAAKAMTARNSGLAGPLEPPQGSASK